MLHLIDFLTDKNIPINISISIFITERNSSCEKVIFLLMFVCPQGACVAGWSMHGRGVCVVGGMCGRIDGH